MYKQVENKPKEECDIDDTMIAMTRRSQRDMAVLESKMKQMISLAEAGRLEEADTLLPEIITMSHRIVLRNRELGLAADDPVVRKVSETILADDAPVEIGFSGEGWFVVRMAPLARTRDTACKEYIRGMIFPAMRRFFADKPAVRFPACTIVYRHVYDRVLPASHRRDYDNVEVKLVTDAVAMYVMVDDSPHYCRMYHCAASGAESRTEVYVMPQEDLPRWLQMEPDFPDEGIPLMDQVPERWKADV